MSDGRLALPRGLYGMADADWGDPVVLGLALAEGGCRVVQLRAKALPAAARLEAARALVAALAPRGVLVIVNDDLQAAADSGAAGLHLGQQDGSLALARARLPPTALVGRSTHGLAQVHAAVAEGADYLGFGPVFPTATKADADPVTGPSALARAVAASPVPVVAIGGIDLGRLPTVRATGAHGWAVVSDLLRHAAAGPASLTARTRLFL